MNKINFNFTNLKILYNEIGLYNRNDEFYKGRDTKYQQILSYSTHIIAAINKLSSKREIVMVDCGCGKSYLSFVLYEYCTVVLKRNVKIIGIDTNAYANVTDNCKESAKNLGYKNMHFYDMAVGDFYTDNNVDIVYSLHACDTATDQTIAAGINLKAKYIFSVSCCQHTNRKQMSGHPLTSVSRFQPYKERLTDMLGDSMRALLLESNNYGVRLFEFTAPKHTPKNIMLRAARNQVKKHDKEIAFANYNSLSGMFKFKPALENLISAT
jgi:hypothetical protein